MQMFTNVARGERCRIHMTLRMDDGAVHRYAPDYTYIELGMRKLVDSEGKEVEEAKRNQTFNIESPCTVKPVREHKILVQVNPELSQVANVPLMFILDYGGDTAKAAPVQVTAQFRKDFDPSKLAWVFRLYLLT